MEAENLEEHVQKVLDSLDDDALAHLEKEIVGILGDVVRIDKEIKAYEEKKGCNLPKTEIGCILAISDRIDDLVGLFAIGKAPTGNKDPYGLKRKATAVIRIMIEKKMNLDLRELISKSVELYGDMLKVNPTEPLLDFFKERLRSYYAENE